MAEASGIDTSLRILALFDKELSHKFRPGNLDISLVQYHKQKLSEVNFANGEEGKIVGQQEEQNVYDIRVEFAGCPAADEIISKLPNVAYMYMVEIEPPTAKSYVVPVMPAIALNGDSAIDTLQESNGGKDMEDGRNMDGLKMNTLVTNRMKADLLDLEIAKEYSVRVSTILNGRTLARRTEQITPRSAKHNN